jgi:tRNA pseudouridine(55) synthase
MSVINIYKPLGFTPLQVIDALRELKPELKDSPITYAGRLDPMAEGVLLLLTDEDVMRKDEFLHLPKVYEAEILFGYSSDTYDALGLVTKGKEASNEPLESIVQGLRGIHTLPFPPYSSFKVNGKPLHAWAREGKLGEIEVPLKQMEVLSVSKIENASYSPSQFIHDLTTRVNMIKGDFRQDAVLESWRGAIKTADIMTTVKATFPVKSGTYIRSLAHLAGERAGTGALLLNLKRVSVGEYHESDSLHLLSLALKAHYG